MNITPEFSPAQVMSPDKQTNGQTAPQQADSGFSLLIEGKHTIPVGYKPDSVDNPADKEMISENGLKVHQCLDDEHSINNGTILSQVSHSMTQEEPDQLSETVSNEELLLAEKEQTGNSINMLNIIPVIKDEIEIKAENMWEVTKGLKEQAHKISDFLRDLIKNYTGELLSDAYGDQAVVKAGDAVEIDSLQANRGSFSESSLMTGSLINNLVFDNTEGKEDKLQEEAFPDEGINPEQTRMRNAVEKSAPADVRTEARPGLIPAVQVKAQDLGSGVPAEKAASADLGTEARPGVIPAIEGEAQEPGTVVPSEKTMPSHGGKEVSPGIIPADAGINPEQTRMGNTDAKAAQADYGTEARPGVVTAVEGEAEGPAGKVPAGRGLKADSPLNPEVDDNIAEIETHEHREIDSANRTNEKSLRTIDESSEASETKHAEAENKTHVRRAVSDAVLKEIKNVTADDSGDFQDIHDDIDIAKITAPKISANPEHDSDNVLRNSVAGNVKAVQGGHQGSETGNGSLMNNSQMSSEGVRHSDSLFTQNSARSAGFNELLDNIIYVARGNNKLGVTLEHELFGRLNINLSLNKGVVNVHINTADSAIREFIENNIQSIVNALAEEDVSVGAFSVGLKGKKNHEGNVFKMNVDKSGEFLQETAGPVNNRGLVNIFV